MRINTNLAALSAFRNLVYTENRLSRSLERLSSGLRINRAADDAAGLSISEKMRGQIRGLNQALRNAQDGISLLQTAEGALGEDHAILQRMRELAVQAASDTLTAGDRVEIQKEIDQLAAEINRIAGTTEFNSKKLLNGTTAALAGTGDLKTKVFIRDGLRVTDQFGQKIVAGSNYKIEIETDPGRGQVLKTDLMKTNNETLERNYVDIEGTAGLSGSAGLQGALLAYPGFSGAAIEFVSPEGSPNQPLTVAASAGPDGMVTVRVQLATDGLGNVTTTVQDVQDAILGSHVREGMGAADGIQTLRFADVPGGGAAGGLFELGYGDSRAWVAVGANENVTAANIQTALEGMAGVGPGNVSVLWRAADSRYEITFPGTAAARVTFLRGATELPGAAAVTHNQTMEQRLSFTTAQHTAGKTFTLDLGADLGQVGPISVGADGNVTAANIKSALDTHLAALGITATVSAGSDATYTHYTIEFAGPAAEVNRIQQIQFGEGVEDDYWLNIICFNNSNQGSYSGGALQIYDTAQPPPWGEEHAVFGEPGRYFRLVFAESVGDGEPFIPRHFTAPIVVGANAAETAANIQGAMNSLMAAHPGDYPGTVSVSWVVGPDPFGFEHNYYRFDFTDDQTYGFGSAPSVAAEAGEHETQLTRLAAANNYQLLVFDAPNPSGPFTLSYDGLATGPIAAGSTPAATAANMEAALRERFGDSGIRVTHREDAAGNTVYAIDFTGGGATPTGGLIYAQGQAFTGGAGTVAVEQAGANGVTLAELLDFRVTGGFGGQVITAGSSTLLDEFYISHAAGAIAGREVALADIDRFFDASGNFFLEAPQTITLIQGDGRRAEVTIFGTDSLADVEAKLNEAIHLGLGQQAYTAGLYDPAAFSAGRSGPAYARYIAPGEGDPAGHFSVEGTFVIQSAVTGRHGEITFSGHERLLEALSLTTIREAEDSVYHVRVSDAHNGAVIADSQKVSNNILVGVVHSNVDVAFDAMANTVLASNGEEFAGSRDHNSYTTFVHLADNTMVFHIGANPLQDVAAAIGDMSAEALGVHNINVTDRTGANRAIAAIDGAIGRVSAERSRLGAIQNRLEHAIGSLGVTAENLASAESRIRDLDFAMEMNEFTRNQIMMQAGTAMLSQANIKPQAVLTLIA